MNGAVRRVSWHCPNNVWAYFNRAATWERMGPTTEAVNDYRLTLKKDEPPLSAEKVRATVDPDIGDIDRSEMNQLLARWELWDSQIAGLGTARAEAERLCGPLTKRPFLVTDNGSSFIAKRFAQHIDGVYSHVRIQYRTPTQLGLLERFHKTLKVEANHSHYISKHTFSQPCDWSYSECGSLVASGALAPAASYPC